MPGIDGIEVAQALRGWSTVPIIVLSARGAEAVKVAALDAGADDYVTKPFGMDELLARVRAALRRTHVTDQTTTITTPHFTIDLGAQQVSGTQGEVRLTPTQWHVIEVLARYQGRLVTQQQLLAEVWGPGHEHASNYLRVFMAQIRQRLEPDPSPSPLLPHRAGPRLPARHRPARFLDVDPRLAMTAPPATSNANLRDESLETMAITIYGVIVLTFMMTMYAFERRDRRFIAAFAIGCLLSSTYGFLSGAWPFGVVEAVWAIIAFRRFLSDDRNDGHR